MAQEESSRANGAPSGEAGTDIQGGQGNPIEIGTLQCPSEDRQRSASDPTLGQGQSTPLRGMLETVAISSRPNIKPKSLLRFYLNNISRWIWPSGHVTLRQLPDERPRNRQEEQDLQRRINELEISFLETSSFQWGIMILWVIFFGIGSVLIFVEEIRI